jgi:RHS repeat-associated protein
MPTCTRFLYDDRGQVQAELYARGAIRRQYIYAADLPVAVIDAQTSLHQDSSAWVQAFIDVGHLLRSWIGKTEYTAWLHTNHLGAPEAATDARGQILWQASYAPSGRAKTVSVRPEPVEGSSQFALALRLPGQYEDAETGLHYNAHRYYDPERGQYLSPDPLAASPGYPDGPNPYAYVRYNPLRYVDPQGLVLFAFDGTGNDRSNPRSLTNVARFTDLYDDGARRYVSGVGTRHIDTNIDRYGSRYTDITPDGSGAVPDRGGNYTGRARIDRMESYFTDELHASMTRRETEAAMNIDIIGFSRGAAQAREFSNRLASTWSRATEQNGQRYLSDGLVLLRDARGVEQLYYRFVDDVTYARTGRREYHCQRVNFRFMGLWDTVLSVDRGSGDPYRMGIPSVFAHVSHAVALNEYRSAPGGESAWGLPQNSSFWNSTRRPLPRDDHYGGFPLESIGASSGTLGRVRVERGFIGAHADVGGGYPDGENQLSFVALNWMVAQAGAAGVNMSASRLPSLPTSNPILHDQSNALRIGDPRRGPLTVEGSEEVVDPVTGESTTVVTRRTITAEDRAVRGAMRGATQRAMGFNNNSLTNAQTHEFIDYANRPITVDPIDTWNSLTGNQTGRVRMAGYMEWLRRNGYCFVGDRCP